MQEYLIVMHRLCSWQDRFIAVLLWQLAELLQIVSELVLGEEAGLQVKIQKNNHRMLRLK